MSVNAATAAYDGRFAITRAASVSSLSASGSTIHCPLHDHCPAPLPCCAIISARVREAEDYARTDDPDQPPPLLAGAGAGAAALLVDGHDLQAQAPSSRTVVFSHTTVVNGDAVQNDVALAVQGGTIVAIGATDRVLGTYPHAEVYDGRGKALVPGLVNCHAHLAATLARGFNEDFGFPNSARLAVQPARLCRATKRR